MRYGYILIAPIITYSNFILIAYNFTFFKEIPFPIFVIILTLGILGTLVALGRIFRRNQLEVDEDLKYERARAQAKTNRIILEALHDTVLSYQMKKQISERIEFLKGIELGKPD